MRNSIKIIVIIFTCVLLFSYNSNEYNEKRINNYTFEKQVDSEEHKIIQLGNITEARTPIIIVKRD